MRRTDRQLTSVLHKLRWVIPALMAVFGVSYILFEHLVIAPGFISRPQLLREIIIIGSIGPTITWILLTWATRLAKSRQQTVATLQRRALQLETASQVSRKVTAILAMDELLPQVVRLIQEKFGYYHVHLFLVDRHLNEIVLQETCGHANGLLKAQGLRFKIGEDSITGWVAYTGKPFLCNDVSQEPRYHRHELLLETRAELAVPLIVGDMVTGVFDVQSDQGGVFREDDVTALQILGTQVAIAIENANLFQKTRHQFETMRALHDISLKITSRLENDRVLAVILEQAACLLNAQGSTLATYDPEENLLHKLAVYNLPSEYEGAVLQPGEGAAGHVVMTGKPLIVNDYQQWEGRSSIFQNSPYDAILSVPLRWQGRILGALSVLDCGERRPFTEDDVRLLTLFADLATIALNNAELYEQVVHLSQHLEQKVEQRTNQLAEAQKALAKKAEQLQSLLATTVRVQEEERTRIARDLHDGSNQLITGTLYEIQAAQECILNQRQQGALGKLKTAKVLLRMIEAENRRIITGLRPPILDAQGLVPALRWYVGTIQELYGLAGSVQIAGQPVRLSLESETAIYRIVQESLANIVAHAQAQNVQVLVDFLPAKLQLTVEDDGVGFDWRGVLAGIANQMGLIGMRERAQSIGGQIEVCSTPGCGTQIVLDVPLVAESTPEAVSG